MLALSAVAPRSREQKSKSGAAGGSYCRSRGGRDGNEDEMFIIFDKFASRRAPSRAARLHFRLRSGGGDVLPGALHGMRFLPGLGKRDALEW